jgi:cell division topological specificity factor
MDIFSFLKGKPKTSDIAKDRLKFVLIHDRANCSPQMLEMLKVDILKAISKYMDIDEDDMDIQISGNDTEGNRNVPVLFANIPIKGVLKASENNGNN